VPRVVIEARRQGRANFRKTAMTGTDKASRRRMTTAAVLAVVAAAVLASFAIASRPGADAGRGEESACKGADKPSVGLSAPQVRKAFRCLVNERRRARDAAPVADSQALQEAAQFHTRKMVKKGCLAHRCGNEPNLEQRVRRSGYLAGASRWQYSENTGCGLSAEAMVANWMASQFHRVNVLEKNYRDVGIGVVRKRTPGHCKVGYSTFTLVFGFREK
jgi:uncharacterized protein YkwD